MSVGFEGTSMAGLDSHVWVFFHCYLSFLFIVRVEKGAARGKRRAPKDRGTAQRRRRRGLWLEKPQLPTLQRSESGPVARFWVAGILRLAT